MDRDQRFQRFRGLHRFLHVRSLERRALIDALRISVPFQLPRFGEVWFWEVWGLWRFWEFRPSELPT